MPLQQSSLSSLKSKLSGNIPNFSSTIGRTPSLPSLSKSITQSVNKLGGTNSTKRTSSTSHVASMSHVGEKNNTAIDPQEQERLDQARYDYGQKCRQAKAIKESKELEKLQSKDNSPYKISTGGTGKTLTDKGRYGFQHKFDKFMRAHKHVYQNLSQKQKQDLHDMIVNKTKNKATGSKLNYLDKKKMKMESYKKYIKGDLSHTNLQTYKKVIDHL